MFKILSIAFFLFLFYRLIVNSGKFLGSSSDQNEDDGEYTDYEEVDSKLKK